MTRLRDKGFVFSDIFEDDDDNNPALQDLASWLICGLKPSVASSNVRARAPRRMAPLPR